MTTLAQALVDKQVRKVRRTIMLQRFVQAWLLLLGAALAGSAIWLLAQRLVAPDATAAFRWAIPGGLLALATLAAAIWALATAPSRATAALALDDRCGLKERVTTFLLLPEELQQTSASHALAQDLEEKLSKLDAASRFPLQVRWQAALAPVLGGALTILAALLAPSLGTLRLTSNDPTTTPIDAQEIKQQLDNLRKASFTPKDPQLKSEELKELEAAWDKLVNKPLDPTNEERVRERVNEMKALEDLFKKRADDLKNQLGKTKDLLQMLEKLALDSDQKLQPGPAKDLEDALSKGNLQKAREILDKLAKDLKNNKLDAEKQKDLAKQFEQLQKKLERLLDQDAMKKDLKKKLDKGEITKEQFDREMKNLKNLGQELPDLKELADLLGKCQNCMKDGDGEQAAEMIGKALDKVQTIELSEEELQDILDQLENLEEAEARILQQLPGNGMGQGGPPGAERPIDPNDPNSKIVDQRQKAEINPKGTHRVTGFAKGGNVSKVPAQEIGGAFQQAAQEAPEAIDRQRIPREAADIARGYFSRLAGQK